MIKQAVIPAAGLGTRFLPVTKIVPKELLPIMAKPVLQYIVEELVQSGIEEIILVLSPEKESIFQYFSEGSFIDQLLDQRGHEDKLLELRRLLKQVTFRRVYQHNPLGLGHAVLSSRREICTDHFAVVLPDDIIFSQTPCMQQLIRAFETCQQTMVALEEINDEHISAYGVVKPAQVVEVGKPFALSQLVEKPSKKDAPSNLAVTGRYILSKDIFSHIPEKLEKLHKEIQLTDAIAQLITTSGVSGFVFEGQRVDVGQPIGFAKANIMMALQEGNDQAEIKSFIEEIGL
ncbi:MAG: NTP transferase domain-containing protein [Deltaproteobacteria bacterium]|nr:NTP transferase domain-containing protein [Deltaproteobacteria bacterium]